MQTWKGKEAFLPYDIMRKKDTELKCHPVWIYAWALPVAVPRLGLGRGILGVGLLIFGYGFNKLTVGSIINRLKERSLYIHHQEDHREDQCLRPVAPFWMLCTKQKHTIIPFCT